MSFFNNLKNIKKNYSEVKASPYKSLIMRYKMNNYMFIFMIGVVIWRTIDLVINYTTFANSVNRIVIIVLGVWLLASLYSNKDKIKAHMKAYEGRPETQGYYDTTINVKSEIDDLINKLKQKEVENDKFCTTSKKASSSNKSSSSARAKSSK
jgi:ABC-type uncharacterized transport system fused permease/ATPase subunit